MLYRDDGTDIVLGIAMSWYMDKPGVVRAYESCNMTDRYAPQHFIAVDGVYTFFKFKTRSTPPLSDDGSREYLQKQPKVTLIDYPGYQIDKRTQYLIEAEKLGCDAIIIIDSDEFLHESWRDWGTFRQWLVKYARSYDPGKDGIIFNLYSWIDKDYEKAYNTTEVEQFTLVPRVWHSPNKLEYYNGVHYWVRRKGSEDPKERIASTHLTIEHGIRMSQDSKLRTLDFQIARNEWAKEGIHFEDELIKDYSTKHKIPYRSVYNMLFGGDDSKLVNVNPLLAIVTNHYDPNIIGDFKKIINVDKLYLDGFESRGEALKKCREFFLEHEEYTHLIVTSDVFNVQRADVNKLAVDLIKNVDVVCGIVDLRAVSSFSFSEVDFMTSRRRMDYVIGKLAPDYKLNRLGFVDIKYSDMVLMGISRRVLHVVEFEESRDTTPDIYFCWDANHKSFQIMMDPNIKIQKYTDYGFSSTSNPTVLFEKRFVDLDSFMD